MQDRASVQDSDDEGSLSPEKLPELDLEPNESFFDIGDGGDNAESAVIREEDRHGDGEDSNGNGLRNSAGAESAGKICYLVLLIYQS